MRTAARILAALVLGAIVAPSVFASRLNAQGTPVNGIPAIVPWENGELLTYDVRFGAIKVGTSRLRVVGQEAVRGRTTWRVRFTVSGGTFFYKVNDLYESWMDVVSLNSLRYNQDLEQGSRDRERSFEIYPERAQYRETTRGTSDRTSVADPLDDGSFLYFIRTVPLEVGRTYTFNRYFRPDRNPVLIRVLRRERVRVPAGEFNAIVIQPIIKTSGIFAEGGQAEIWLSDDADRMMLQMKSRLSFGTLNLYLRAFRRSAISPAVGAERDTVP